MLSFNLISLLLIVCGAAVLGLQTPDIAAAARVYPAVMIALVIVCSLAIAAKEIAGRATTEPLDKKLAQILSASTPFRVRLLGYVATWAVYPVALSYFGFIVSTTCVLSVSLWVLETRKILAGVVMAAVFSVTFAILFATVLYIPTPMGALDELLIQGIYAIQH